MNPAPPLLVIIVAYNSGALLQRCVDALAAQQFGDFRAVIWDNASSDDAVARLRVDDRFNIVRHSENLGFAAANNRAAAGSASKYIATLNPDAFADKDWLGSLYDTAERSGAEAVGSLQLDEADPERLDGAGDCMSFAGIAWRGGFGAGRSAAPTRTSEIFAPCAAAALYRRDAFERLGGFDERFFCYFEDVDLGYRLRLLGGRCLLEPKAVVYHVGSATTGRQSDFSEYHGARNRLWTFLRDTPTVLLPIAAPAHILILAYVLARSPGLVSARLRGLRDGWRGRGPFLAERNGGLCPFSLLSSLTWSPLAISRRSIKARPL